MAITNTAYIRNMDEGQKKLLNRVSQDHNIKCASKSFIFVLEQYFENQREIRSLHLNKASRDMKIENLEKELSILKSYCQEIFAEEFKLKKIQEGIQKSKSNLLEYLIS